MNIPLSQLVILHHLREGPNYGLGLVELSDHLEKTSIYVHISRLQEKGLLLSTPEERDPHKPGIPKRILSLTPSGQAQYQQWINSLCEELDLVPSEE